MIREHWKLLILPVDVIFARINNRQKAMDGTPEEISAILKRARANGKAIVGMKIYGAGTLTAGGS